MCQAFSCLVLPDTTVVWQFGVDSHEELLKLTEFKFKDDTADPNKMTFCRVEISPKNKNYLEPDKWALGIDQEKPMWWTSEHADAAEKAHKEWMKKLDKLLLKKPIIRPFRDITPPKKITKKHLDLLSAWVNAWAGMRINIWNKMGAMVGASTRNSIWNNVGISVWDRLGANMAESVEDHIVAYTGSFFKFPSSTWKYTKKIKIKGYPFQSAVDLWMMGLVLSFDGQTWRLHGGKNGKVLWEGDERAFLKKEK